MPQEPTRRVAPPLRAAPSGHAAPPRARRRAAKRLGSLLGLTVALASIAACAGTTEMGPPEPTPADITGIVGVLLQRGVTVRDLVSGDAGCDDPDMIASAIAFTVAGLDEPGPIPVRIYIFRNAESYQKLRSAVDACAADWITDPAGYEVLDVSPFVLVGQGPWPPGLKTTLREALTAAAGNGG